MTDGRCGECKWWRTDGEVVICINPDRVLNGNIQEVQEPPDFHKFTPAWGVIYTRIGAPDKGTCGEFTPTEEPTDD